MRTANKSAVIVLSIFTWLILSVDMLSERMIVAEENEIIAPTSSTIFISEKEAQNFDEQEIVYIEPNNLVNFTSFAPLNFSISNFEISESEVDETKSLTNEAPYEPQYVIDFTEEELVLMCEVVDAEAHNQDDYGKFLVATVIVNRVLSEDFGSTLTEVLYSPGQFAVVTNGMIYNSNPDLVLGICLRALDSTNNDHACGAVYFCTLAKDHGNASFLFTYGDHKFYR